MSSEKFDPEAHGTIDPYEPGRLTERWVREIVVGLNLCPFAAPVLNNGRIRYAVARSFEEEDIYQEFLKELEHLIQTPEEELATTLIIAPNTLEDFIQFNDFVGLAEEMVEELGVAEQVHVASFHPGFYFADTQPGDLSNFTNRSPFPTLHLIRQSDLTRAVESFGDTMKIPERNMDLLERMGVEKVLELFKDFRPENRKARQQ